MSRNVTAVLIGLSSLLTTVTTSAAPLATMTYTLGVVRPQVQGAGTYDVFDFYWTNTPGAQFTNYTLTGTATTGGFADPARLQDDRQTETDPGTQDGNTAGAVDMWANTVMSAAAKVDGGYNASITANPAGYVPAGSGAAPTFTHFEWDVFDTVGNDDNDLNDHPDGPFSAAAPYHLARVLALPGSTGSFTLVAYDTANPGVGTPYVFTGIVESFNVYDDDLGEVPRGTTVSATLDAAGVPIPPLTWVLDSFTGPNGAISGAEVDLNTGEFTWNSSGATLGNYSAVIRVIEAGFPGDTGTLSFNLIVPEPASFALTAIAVLGATSIRRRK